MPKILDNIGERLGDELLRTLESSHSLDTAVGYFNLRGWRLIAAAVDGLAGREGKERPGARVLVGITEDPCAEMRRLAGGRVPQLVDHRTANGLKDAAVEDFRTQLEVGVPTAADEAALRALQRQIDGGTVEVRLHTAHRLHAKLYLCHRADTAVARLLQEEHGFETLVACPKNLVGMWQDYLHRYEVRGRVVSLSMVHRKLPDARRHRLVIIDEAHNLRNERRRDHKALRAYIGDNDSRVLLLSATPYNKGLSDLAAQLALFLDPHDDLGLRPERAIAAHPKGAGGYQYDCAGASLTSLAAFKRSEDVADWQALLSQFLVRRTRGFIEEHYTHADERGRRYLTFGSGERFYFPRRQPVPVEVDLPPGDAAATMASDQTLDVIGDLYLPRYQLGDYLRHGFEADDADERALLDDLANAARGNLSGFTRIMMFKRLSSSGPAFLATLRRHRLRNLVALHALEAGLAIPVGPVDNALWEAEANWMSDELDADADHDDTPRGPDFGPAGSALFPQQESSAERAYDALVAAAPKAIRWAPPEAFLEDLREELTDDTEAIGDLLNGFGPWNADRDGKLAALEGIITERHPDEKVLVFTEAADTAHYIEGELRRRGIAGAAAVTGSSPDPSALARRFSPRSGRDRVAPGEELRILVSTDVLSEGQNLQDSRIVINYDLPWAVVRLVQRAGRVDRIGQRAGEVIVYSLLPTGSVEAEIRLRERIRERLAEQATLLGSDEQFFGDPSERHRLGALYDEHSDFALADSGDDVDPISMAYEIWRHATEAHPDLAEAAAALPDVVHATRSVDNTDTLATSGRETVGVAEPGGHEEAEADPRAFVGDAVVVHSRTVTGSDAFAIVSATDGEANRIAPQEALRLAECEPGEPAALRHAAVRQRDPGTLPERRRGAPRGTLARRPPVCPT